MNERNIDWDPNPVPRVVLQDDNKPCDCYNRLQDALDRVDGAYIPYNPLGDNSNATAHDIVENAGFSRPIPPVWAPGAGNKLIPSTPTPTSYFSSENINVNTPSIYLGP